MGGISSDSPYAHYRLDDIQLYKVGDRDNCISPCVPKPTDLISEDTLRVTPIMFVADTFLVHFASSSFAVNEMDKDEISYLKKQLGLNPELQIIIEGHADNSGKEIKNMELSKKRAYSVYEILIAAGMDEKIITLKFHGSSLPISPNNTRKGKRLNRRVEVYLE